MMRYFEILLFVIIFNAVFADVFLQNPRGSNNRVNELTANRKGNNRLFDSQNNAKGGYNVGDRLNTPHVDEQSRQYSMQYYASGPSEAEASKLMVEWTNQHGCGDNPKLICNIVVQYMCQSNGTHEDHPQYGEEETKLARKLVYMRDGNLPAAPTYRPTAKKENPTMFRVRNDANMENVIAGKGQHETYWWYDTCRYREANQGLYTADQNRKKGNIGYPEAHKTRQNSGGGKSGYECPEERDYYPYWQPTNQQEDVSMYQNTPWLDLAWLGDTSRCEYIKANSYNQNPKYRCVYNRDEDQRSYGREISKEACTLVRGVWVEFTSFLEILDDIDNEGDCEAANDNDARNKIFWGKTRSDNEKKQCIVQAPEVICDKAPYTRVNHLGNADMGGMSGQNSSRVEMDMPHFPSGDAKRCVLRLRYNITTTDYDPLTTDSDSNDAITDNPQLDILGNGELFDINLNTNQIGRTFQDRSHVFVVLPRTEAMAGKTLYNLNVQGKRGNLEETVPATEYGFVPDRLVVKKDDLVHIQWTGSNTHRNNNDGNTGQGAQGTDRNNLLQMESLSKNTPFTLADAKFWSNVESLTNPEATSEDIAVGFATSGFYCGKKEFSGCPKEFSMEESRELHKSLNNAPASYFGHVLRFKDTGSMFYMCSRNNDFSNRSQKGALWVEG